VKMILCVSMVLLKRNRIVEVNLLTLKPTALERMMMKIVKVTSLRIKFKRSNEI